MSRLLSLARLSRRRLGESFGARAARAYGSGIAASYALLVLVLPASSDPRAFDALLKNALTAGSWAVAGLVGLAAAKEVRGREGLEALAESHGYDARDVGRARLLATAFVIAFWLFVPMAALSVVAGLKLAIDAAELWALAWIAFLGLYVPLLAVSLSALARVAARLAPSHGRLLLAGLVLVPHLLHTAFPELPSLPAAFGWLLDRGAGLVARVT